MAAEAFTLSGSLVFPPDTGQPNVEHPFSLSGSFNPKLDSKFEFVGGGTYTVSLPGSAQMKVVLIEYESGAQPIQVENNSNAIVELTAGGFFCFANPSPSSGVTSLDIVYTVDAVVRVRVLA